MPLGFPDGGDEVGPEEAPILGVPGQACSPGQTTPSSLDPELWGSQACLPPSGPPQGAHGTSPPAQEIHLISLPTRASLFFSALATRLWL